MRGILCVLLMAIGGGGFAAASQGASVPASEHRIEGAWLQEVMRNVHDFKEVKLIGSGHFMWLAYEDGRFRNTGGGTYRIDATAYVEHADFITTVNEYLGKDLPLTLEWKGPDEFVESGKMPDGQTFTETWKRMP